MRGSHGTCQGVPCDPEAHLESLPVGEIRRCSIRWQIQHHGKQPPELSRHSHRILLGQRGLDEADVSSGCLGDFDALDGLVQAMRLQ